MNLECALQQAHLYYQSQNIQSARKVYRQILRHDPMCAQAWNRLGIIAYELGRPEIGVELISAVQCQMAHAQYFVVETEDYSKLHELFSPFQGIATADFTPVRDLMSP